MKEHGKRDAFDKIDKFGAQLLVAFTFTIVLLVGLNAAFAGPNDYSPPQEQPRWVEKPVQCASPNAVMRRIEKDNMLPLMAMTGNARVDEEMYSLPYGFFYNPETQYWLFVEFFSPDTSCIIGVGQGVEFDVAEDLSS